MSRLTLPHTLCLLLVCIGPAQAQEKGFDIVFRWELLGAAQVGLGPVSFNNIPQGLRTVPSNQAGPLAAGTPVTIPGSSFNIPDPKFIAFQAAGFAPQYTVKRFTFRGGVYLTLPNTSTPGAPTADSGPYQEINQYGTSARGVGTSLVYYSVHWGNGGTLNPRPFGELEFRVVGPFSVIGGYGGFEKTSGILLVNGYDQYDALTPYSTQTIAQIDTKAYGLYGSAKVKFGRYGGAFLKVVPTTTTFTSTIASTVTSIASKQKVDLLLGIDINVTQTMKKALGGH